MLSVGSGTMLLMKCKYCESELIYSKKPRTTGACSKCKYKHFRELNPEKFKERSRAWWASNKNKGKIIHDEWRKKNPEKWNAKQRRASRSLNGQYGHGKCKAKKFNQSWDLSKEQYAEIRNNPCIYCGGKLNETGSGLDRKDCSLGYTLENVVPCCGPCNRIKRELLTYNEMKVGMKAIMDFRRLKTNS